MHTFVDELLDFDLEGVMNYIQEEMEEEDEYGEDE